MYDLPAYGVHQYSQHTPPPANNIIRKNLIHDFSKQTTSAAGILLTSGDGSKAYNNIVYNGAVGIAIGAAAVPTIIRFTTIAMSELMPQTRLMQ